MKLHLINSFLIGALLVSCNSAEKTTPKAETNDIETKPTFQNEAHELVYAMTQKVGDYNTLLEKEDVVYTYTYQTPDGKTDVTTEKYIFDGELSYGAYRQHERTLPDVEGLIEQGYDGEEFWMKQDGKVVTDEEALKRVAFNRPTNFYWFTMMQKLMDPGVNYELLNDTTIEGTDYEVIKITFASQNDKPTDIYQLYMNKETGLIDQFLFTVVDFGKVDIPMLMQMEYVEVDGMLIPANRQYKSSTWDAEVSDAPWINVTWSDITFNNGLSPADFKKENTMENNMTTSLKSKLDEKKANFELKADDNKKRIYAEGIAAVVESGVLNKAKKAGDKAPNFVLNNALGEPVALADYLKKGPVVLTWYRGGWCPYCNLTLAQLQDELPNFKAEGANLIALTPELPDSSISTSEKNDLQFEVLSDIGNKVANEYGIVFQLTDDVATIYNKAFDLNTYNGDDSNELPLAATYIIDTDGTITYAFLDADYRNRAEPSEITELLEKD